MGARYSRQRGYEISGRKSARPTIRTVQRKMKFGPAAARYFGIALLAVLALIFMASNSASSTDIYKVSSLNKDLGEVHQQVDELKLAADRAQSLSAVQNTAVKDSLVPVANATYIQPSPQETGQVAGVSTSR